MHIEGVPFIRPDRRGFSVILHRAVGVPETDLSVISPRSYKMLRIRREMPRAFIWYVYCGDSLHLAEQERSFGDSAPLQGGPCKSPNGHSSATV